MSDSSARSRSAAAATQRWLERLERFAAGNHTVAAFYSARGVSASIFYTWRRRLAEHDPLPAVVRNRFALPAPVRPIELALESGTVVRFPADVRPEMLVAVLRGLGSVRADRPTHHQTLVRGRS